MGLAAEWTLLLFLSPNRFNFTNVDEPLFVLDTLELINARLIDENDSVLIVVYAVNQKGKSVGVVIRDLELGATVRSLDRGNEPSA